MRAKKEARQSPETAMSFRLESPLWVQNICHSGIRCNGSENKLRNLRAVSIMDGRGMQSENREGISDTETGTAAADPLPTAEPEPTEEPMQKEEITMDQVVACSDRKPLLAKDLMIWNGLQENGLTSESYRQYYYDLSIRKPVQTGVSQ